MTPGLFTLLCPCGGELGAQSGDDDHVCSKCGAHYRVMFGCLVKTESGSPAPARPLVTRRDGGHRETVRHQRRRPTSAGAR